MNPTRKAPQKRTHTRKPKAPGNNKAPGNSKAKVAATAAIPPEVSPSAPLYVATIDVRWRDLDAFNHVNNAMYLSYLEEARLHWLRTVSGPWFDEHSMPVLAACELNYRRPIEWPARIHVQMHCERLGNSSITVAHRITDAADETCLYNDGRVVIVWTNPTTGEPVPLPQAIRDSATA